MAKLIRPKYFILVCLALGWLFDYLFWAKPWGISFPIFTFVLVVAGLLFARSVKLAPAPRALWLLIPIAFLALVSAFRTESFTLLFSRALVLLLLCILALSFLGGKWLDYNFSDFIAKLLVFIPFGLKLLGETHAASASKRKSDSFRQIRPVLRGLLIAIPLLWFFIILLSSADPIFAKSIQDFFSFLNLNKAAEYLFRAFYVVILAFLFAAVYLFALFKSRNEVLLGKDKPVVQAFLGFGEAITVLASVNLLFAAFVVIQFKIFFGGGANIAALPLSFTYAEYARRGFAELVFVAITSLLFFMALSSIAQRKASQQIWFSGLGIALFALVAVIMTSAFQRLLLYEDAYGFTQIRTIVHVFMIWLGLLLLAVVLLETFKRGRAFAVASLFAAFGFAISLALLNVDGFIARANIERGFLRPGERFDWAYLGTLSTDSMPALVAGFYRARDEENSELLEGIAAAMACNAKLHNNYHHRPIWQSWNVSYAPALDLWLTIASEPAFPLVNKDGNVVSSTGEVLDCFIDAD